jgi:multicomponent K+:H+ antiporter subunit E
LGLLLGWLIPLFTLRFWPETVRIRHPGVLLRFVGVVPLDIVVANLAVAWRILGKPARLRPAFVEVPLSLESDLAISLLANTICLTPGTVSALLSEETCAPRSKKSPEPPPAGAKPFLGRPGKRLERRVLLAHALDAPDPDAVRDHIKSRYEAPLKAVFEAC